jgi:hypothetical protein
VIFSSALIMPVSRALACSHRALRARLHDYRLFNRAILFGAVVNLERERIGKRRWTSNTSGALQKSAARLVVISHVHSPATRRVEVKNHSSLHLYNLVKIFTSRVLTIEYRGNELLTSPVDYQSKLTCDRTTTTTVCIPRSHHNSLAWCECVPSLKQTINHQSSTLLISFGRCNRNV